jgi:glycosyltransferase involved in cell wall biosynthesis
VNKPLNTIAVDLTPVLPGGENGGAKIFVLELLQRLAEIAPQTQFILLTQTASHEELEMLDRPNIRRLNMMMKPGGTGALLSGMSVDLLFCPFTAPTYFESCIPTVCTIYDLQYKTYPDFFDAEDVDHRNRTFFNACLHSAMITCISDYSRESAIKHGNLDPARIRTIYLQMAQRISSADKSDNEVLARYGLTPQRYLIYPANFWKHKNHEMLLTAFGMACQRGLAADIKLVCTGAPGARQEWLLSVARAMNLADRVTFPGYLPKAELAVLMATSSGMVFPSLYEGFGLPVIEAMAAGVPVACSKTTSLPEVAGDAAILFDPGVPTQIAQAMISLVDDEVLRIRLIQAGQLRAAKFSNPDRMAKEYWAIFQQALTQENSDAFRKQNIFDRIIKARAEATELKKQNIDTLRQIHILTEWVHEARAEVAELKKQNIDALRQIHILTEWVHEARAEGAQLRAPIKKLVSLLLKKLEARFSKNPHRTEINDK